MENLLILISYILEFIFAFIENYLVIYMLELFFEKKRNISIIVVFLLTIFSNILNKYVYPPIYCSIFLLMFLYGYVFFNLDGKMYKKVIVPIFVYINLFIINISTAVIFHFFNKDFSVFISAFTLENILLTIFTKSILLIECICLSNNIRDKFYVSKETWLPSIVLVLSSMVVPEIALTQFINNDNVNGNITVFIFVSFIIVNIMVCFILKSSNKVHMKILEQEILLDTKVHEQKLIDMIELKIEEMNRLNHDINNHKSTIQNMILNKSNDDVNNYVNELFNTSFYIKTNNSVLNYILNEKIGYAQNQGIDVKCIIQGDFSKTISTIDLSIVIGNLLDNAIEANENVDDKHININIVQDKYKLLIKVSNTCCNNVFDINQKYFTTKKEKKRHGYGLSNIRLICQKYNGDNYIEKQNNMFKHTCIFLITES